MLPRVAKSDNGEELTCYQDLPDRRLAKAVIHRALADLEYALTHPDEIPKGDHAHIPDDRITRITLLWIDSNVYDYHSFLWWLNIAWKSNEEVDYYLNNIRNYVATHFPNK